MPSNAAHEAPEVVLYGAPDCGLCSEARAELDALVARHGGSIREANVRLDLDLEREHGERIPVVVVDGVEVSAGRFDRAAVRAALRQAAARA